MRMSSLHLIVVVTAFAVTLASGCGRPNPRLSKLERTQGNGSQTTRLDYDDHAHLTAINAEVGNGTDDTTLTWDGAQITKIETNHNKSFGKSSVDRTDLTYTDGRLSKMSTDVGDATTVVTATFEYDDHGNLSKITNASVTDDKNKLTTTVTLEYGDKGLTRRTTLTDLVLGGFESKSTVVDEIDYGSDGRPSKFTSDPDQGDTTIVDLSYDTQHGGRLEKQDVSGGLTGADRYDYDDQGRISGATLEAKGQDDANVTLEYDDAGDVADLDITPTSIGLVQLFDLRGDAFNTIDPARQAVRFGGLTW